MNEHFFFGKWGGPFLFILCVLALVGAVFQTPKSSHERMEIIGESKLGNIMRDRQTGEEYLVSKGSIVHLVKTKNNN